MVQSAPFIEPGRRGLMVKSVNCPKEVIGKRSVSARNSRPPPRLNAKNCPRLTPSIEVKKTRIGIVPRFTKRSPGKIRATLLRRKSVNAEFLAERLIRIPETEKNRTSPSVERSGIVRPKATEACEAKTSPAANSLRAVDEWRC